ncbi:hypothetical protein EsDP_00006154 [Epichloe bromicola]|uniref:rRNA N-glycosylase n=1 Tax=Epichloe bromicola TaxID=79588 RepID=A0ABQ0CWU7_9HYPO
MVAINCKAQEVQKFLASFIALHMRWWLKQTKGKGKIQAKAAVRFRLRRDNLYLEAYRNEAAGQWREFANDGNLHLVTGSALLRFTGSYTSLTRVAGERRDQIRLSQGQLIAAVNDLATSDNDATRAGALVIVLQMVCESARFSWISDQLSSTYTTEPYRPLETLISISTSLNYDDEDPANVYGWVFADSSAYDAQIDLLHTTAAESVKVSPGQPIPLARTNLAVPMDARLYIHVNLFDHDSASADDEIASGSWTFAPQLFTSSSFRIAGEHGMVEVRVSWM